MVFFTSEETGIIYLLKIKDFCHNHFKFHIHRIHICHVLVISLQNDVKDNFQPLSKRKTPYEVHLKVKCESFSHVWLFVTPWTIAHRLLCSWNSPKKNTGVGCHFLLQGIFLTQELNLGLCTAGRLFTNWAIRWMINCSTL